MPKQHKTAILEEMDDDSIEIDLSNSKPSRKFGGNDADPTDAETGEELFADITPRLRDVRATEPEEEEEEEEEDEREEDEDDLESFADDEDEETDDLDNEEVDSDAEADRKRGKKPGKKISSWQRRLQRERRLTEEERENNRELRARLDKIEATVKTTANTETYNREKADLEAKIATANEQLEAAIEDGDTKAQAKINGELIDLKVDLRAKASAHAQAVEAAKTVTSTTDDSTIIVRKVKQWQRKHPRFQRDIEFQGFVRGADKAVAAAGFDPETDEYYKELDRRIKKRYPEEYKMERRQRDEDTDETEEETPAPRRRHPSQQLRRGNDRGTKDVGGFKVRGTKVTLSARQKANMRNFQMDPSNPDDVKEYVLNNMPKK
jgi:hypothetical protein